MSRKRTNDSAEFKSKLVLEVLKNERTLAEIASANNITPKNLQNWKKIFLENAEIAMEPSKAVKEYKEELSAVQEQNEMLTKIVGKMTVEKEWLEKKLKSLGLSDKKLLIEPKLESISLSQQCALLGMNRSSIYYKSSENPRQNEIKTQIVQIFEEIPIYGAAKVHQQLLEDGVKISLNTVASYRQQLGLKAILAVKQVNTTVPIKAHKKYDLNPASYKNHTITILYKWLLAMFFSPYLLFLRQSANNFFTIHGDQRNTLFFNSF
jgi:putative transposase